MGPQNLRILRIIATPLIAAGLAACGSSSDSAKANDVHGTVTVYAAQSLSKAFADIGKAFEAEHNGTSVTFNFAGSSTLITQIQQGAPADVIATADESSIAKLNDAKVLAGAPAVFATNMLQIAVAKKNPKGITALADLARADVTTVLCAETVPCGKYARQALAAAAVTVTPQSTEQNVAAVVGRVSSGEADAGIVYVTDVMANPKIDGVALAAEHNVVARYPIAALKSAANAKSAEAFAQFVVSPTGQAILLKYGFKPK